MQPHNTKNHATSKKSQNLSTQKIIRPLQKITQTCEWVRTEEKKPFHTKTSRNLSTQKSRNLSIKKITQLLAKENCTTSPKNWENPKMLPWELHIGCQICQIALFKSTVYLYFFLSLLFFFLEFAWFFLCLEVAWLFPLLSTLPLLSLLKKKYFLVLLERAIWQIWQPM